MTTVEPFEIRLDQYLKHQGLVATGGQAKQLIQDGQVVVNGVVESRRRRKLHEGDVVETGGVRRAVCRRVVPEAVDDAAS